MSAATRIAFWAIVAVTAILTVTSGVFLVASWTVPAPEHLFSHRGANTISAAAMLPLAALLVTRRPANLVGWMLLAIAAVTALYGLATEYGIHALGGGRDLAGGIAAAWTSEWIWVPLVGLAFPVLLLVFPSGTLLSPRWRWAVALAAGVTAAQAAAFALHPGVLRYLSYDTPNPFAIAGTGSELAAIEGITRPLSATVLALTVLSLVVRYRRSDRVTRLQLKWLALASLIAAISYALALSFPDIELFEVGVTISGISLTVAIAIAILRYRLYEIDVIIRRTLVYGALSVALLATYVGLVVLVQTVLRQFTAGSELAVAGSTLATLALVQPLRRRIRGVVDHRFYRSRYDASRTLDAFTTRMRDQVDIEAVRSEVLDVVGTTLRPAHASVWLRK